MKSYIGIDFGACNIKAAKVSESGKTQKIKLNKTQAGGNFIPNVILYDEVKGNIEIKVGSGAKNSKDFENKIWQIKSKLSQKIWHKFIKSLGREVAANEAVKDIFEWLWRTITEKFSKAEELEAVITVPVSFSEVQKNLMKQAAISAGVPVSAVVTEPFAAMFSLEDFFEEDEEQTVLIFDIGGSTLDLSLFRVENFDDELNITELAAAGLKFGGIDIDKAIFNNIFLEKYGEKIKQILDSGTPQYEIMNEIEKVKEEAINDGEEVSGFITDKNGGLHEFTLSPEEINAVLEKINVKEKIIALLDELFEDAEIDKGEVTAVKPFGGTSSIDYFTQMLTDYFGAEIFDCEDFEKDDIYMNIALGAAKYLYFVNGENSNVSIQNVIPYNIGLAKENIFSRSIKRNELSGFVTPMKPLLISELEKNNWRVAVYQSFANAFELSLESEDVIFIGDVELNKDLYSVNDAVLFNLRTDDAGQIIMKFFEFPPNVDEPQLIEEKIVKAG